MEKQVVICSAARTPVGNINGCISSLSASDLGAVAVREALKRAGVSGDDVSEVILGQALMGGCGQNPARQASVAAGIPHGVPACTVNMLCGSGLRSVVMGCQAIICGDAEVVVAGGQESMSNAPHCVPMRSGVKFGDVKLVDTMLKDGIVDAFDNIHMGLTAENVADLKNISRAQQDEYALESQNKTQGAINAGNFHEEIVPVIIPSRKGEIRVEKDEFPRAGCSLEGLAKLRASFKDRGTVTAGNASGLNDGAAAFILMTKSEAEKQKIPMMAKIMSWAQVGIDPKIMGLGPVEAVKKALAMCSWSVDDVDLFELNEAFAAPSIAVARELGVNGTKVNVNGGAIALGHPIGASGARILVTLIYAMKRLGVRRGVCGLCVGGGMGIAMCVEAM